MASPPKMQPAAGGDERHRGRALLVEPAGGAGVDGDGADGAEPVGAGGELVPGRQHVGRAAALGRRQQALAGVAQGEVHGVGEGAVGAGLPVLAAGPARAGQQLLAEGREDDLGVLGHVAGGAVDVRDHVLGDGGVGPQELAGLAVEGVDDAGLAGDAGHHPALLARLQPGVDPGDGVGVGGDGGVDEQPLEGVVEVPVVVQVLVVPPDLAGVGVEGEGRVVVQVRQLGAAEHELRGRRGDRRADVDEVQLGVVSSGPSRCRRACAARTARRPTSRRRARPARGWCGAATALLP